MVVPGMMPMLPASSKSMSRSLESASPASIRESSLNIHCAPSRHGVHCPQDSFLKNRERFRATATMSVSSSKTVGTGGAKPHQVVLATDVEIHFGFVLIGGQDAHRAPAMAALKPLPPRMPPQ